MRILIVEDEFYAAKRLKSMLLKELPDASILEVFDTIEETVNWLSSHVEPNLIFMDIQLADGLSFQIFDKVKVACPIIFVTAYDEYALSAFKVNSIDYLLKPIEEKDLRTAINKYQQMYAAKGGEQMDWQRISRDFIQPQKQFKQRFLIKRGNAYAYLNTSDIRLIYSEDGLSFALCKDNKKQVIDQSLEKIHTGLNPDNFFKVGRKHIVALTSIQQIHPYLNGRLKLDIDGNFDAPIIVSRERVKAFKAWLDK